MRQKKRSLKKSLVYFIIICWFIPIILFSYFILVSYKDLYMERTSRIISSGVKGSTTLVTAKVNDMIRTAQQPSYERAWEYAWTAYDRGEISRTDLFAQMNYSLRFMYLTDDRFDEYAFYLTEEAEPLCYRSKIRSAWEQDTAECNAVSADIRKEDTSYIQIKEHNNKLYLIRNLYRVTDYTKFGTLVLAINTDILFEGFPMDTMEDVAIAFNDEDYIFYSQDKRAGLSGEQEEIYESMKQEMKELPTGEVHRKSGRNYEGYSFSSDQDKYKAGIYYVPSHENIYEGMTFLYDMIGILACIFVPIVLFIVYFLTRQIEEPLEKLIQVSQKIREGEWGATIEEDNMPNKEFKEVVYYFNSMSERIKYLIDTVYTEKIARRDAQLLALQAQINPHFLNNTLEMMNWQARMNKDITVSKMIEALGTVMDYTINRDNVKEGALSEEIRCVESYLYIMSMRFGQRLKVEQEIDEKLLQIKVPQLILQPLIENAILHGVEKSKTGTIWLKVHHDNNNVYLDVLNTGGKVDEKALERIQDIISGKDKLLEKGPGRHTSIGIWNVNKRIQLMFGTDYGLSITLQEDDKVCSRITLPYRESGNDGAAKEQNL